jgi:diaminopimelate decarboxylase
VSDDAATPRAAGTGDTGSRGPEVRRLAEWDGVTLDRLASEYDTPLYLLDLDRIRENVRRFRDSFPDARVMYAAKANTGRATLSTLVDADVPIECAAAGEVERAIRAGADPGEIQYTAVNPPSDDLDYAIELWNDAPGLTITAGARDTIDRLAERGFDGRLCIRVNPGVGLGHHEKVATGSHPKFGVPLDRVPEVAEYARERMDLVGLHAHVGSGILDADDLADHTAFVERMSDLADAVAPLEFVDLGGGFGVPYREDEPPLDLDAMAERTRDAFTADADIKVEPGRYLVADAACILTRVNTIKPTDSTTVVGVDASMTTLIRPALYGAYHAIRNVTRPDAPREPLTVGGPVCESSDTFCEERPLPRPERGDLLAIGNGGAYGYEMASQFHSQPRPAVLALDGDSERIVRERETIEDVLRGEHA